MLGRTEHICSSYLDLQKKQGAISHSISEAEIIALEAGVRMEGIPCLVLWREIISVFSGGESQAMQTPPPMHTIEDVLANVDYAPTTLPENDNQAVLLVMEDNEAVIKMVIKTRAASMRHTGRTHRIVLDWLFERFHLDPAIQIRFVGTKEQIADFLI